MTEKRIFQLLLDNKKNKDYNLDYPTLQKISVEHVAQNFTDIIYETLKQKSSASSNKRGNLLKFINHLCQVKEYHLNDDSYRCYLKPIGNCFKAENEKASKLVHDINADLDQYLPQTFAQEIVAFYKKKHFMQKKKIKDLELIKTMDQEQLNTKYDMMVRKNFSYYETNENLICDLLSKVPSSNVKNKIFLQQIETLDYREKQIKLCYGLINLRNQNVKFLPDIQRILQKLSVYPNLREFEINFIQYLWVLEDVDLISMEHLVEQFPFLLERIILKYATQLLSIKNIEDVEEYFIDLESDQNFLKMRKLLQCKLIEVS